MSPGNHRASDNRCDRCGAESKVVYGKEHLKLYFCGHHAEEHKPAMFEQGWARLILVLEK